MGSTSGSPDSSRLDAHGKGWRFFGLVGLDIILLLVGMIVTLMLAFNKLTSLPPFHRGFFCDDQSLMYPFHPETISTEVAAVISMLPCICTILIVEAAHTYKARRCLCPSSRSVYVRTCYKTIGSFCFGEMICLLITEVIKLMVGRLRPHFFAVCQPDLKALNCTNQFVVDFQCYGTDTEAISDARKSFPSGHTSSAVYSMMFMIIYLQIRVKDKWEWFRALCPLLQGVAFCVAAYVSISRLQDYKHHVGDVMGGAFLGVVMSFCTVKFIFKYQRKRRHKSQVSDDNGFSSTTKTESCVTLGHDDGHDNLGYLESPRSDASFKTNLSSSAIITENSDRQTKF